STQFAGLRAAGRVCTNTSGDAGMKKASTRLLEQETQTPSPAPDLIPAESSTENLHWDWYSKRGHFITSGHVLLSRFHSPRGRKRQSENACGGDRPWILRIAASSRGFAPLRDLPDESASEEAPVRIRPLHRITLPRP